MTTWHRVTGDLDDTIPVYLDGIADLDNATGVNARVWTSGADSTILTAEVTDSDARLVTVALGSDDGWLAHAQPGKWKMRTRVTFADGSRRSWPAQGTDLIIVGDDGALVLDVHDAVHAHTADSPELS